MITQLRYGCDDWPIQLFWVTGGVVLEIYLPQEDAIFVRSKNHGTCVEHVRESWKVISGIYIRRSLLLFYALFSVCG